MKGYLNNEKATEEAFKGLLKIYIYRLCISTVYVGFMNEITIILFEI